jgi:superoxide dismutase, Cu-Zn family
VIRIAAVVGLASVAVVAQMKWTAKLDPQGDAKVSGTATVEGKGASSTHATVSLTGGTPGATYPWHVHAGNCSSNGAVVGQASAYTPIKIGKDGSGKADVTLPFAIPDNGSYYVNIHKSPTDLGTIVSCGNLSMSGM